MKNRNVKLYGSIIILVIAVAILIPVFAGCIHKPQSVALDSVTEESMTGLEAEYQKKFGESISELERSIMGVGLGDILISKIETENVIWAHYIYRNVDLGMELDMSEWVDIVRALSNGIRNSKEQNNRDTVDWIYIKCKQCPEPQREVPMYLPAWDDLHKIMVDLTARIKKEAGVEIWEMEYEKRFAAPISNMEFSTFFLKYQDTANFFGIRKNATGAIATDDILCKDCLSTNITSKCDDKCYRLVNLDIGEWLDFVNALYKSGIAEWQNIYKTDTTLKNKWNVEIGFSRRYNNLNFGSDSIYPSNWDEFGKLMKDMERKIKEKISVAEIKLKEGYAERNMETSVQEFERSAKLIQLRQFFSDSYYREITMNKTVSGAIVTIFYGQLRLHYSVTYKGYIDMNEWLDFVNILHKYSNVARPINSNSREIQERYDFEMCPWENVTASNDCGNKDDWKYVDKFLLGLETKIRKVSR